MNALPKELSSHDWRRLQLEPRLHTPPGRGARLRHPSGAPPRPGTQGLPDGSGSLAAERYGRHRLGDNAVQCERYALSMSWPRNRHTGPGGGLYTGPGGGLYIGD